jgi:hypothetical protein
MASYLSSCSVRVSCLQRETREGAGAHSWRRAAVVLRLRALDDVPPFALAAAGDGNQIQRIGPTAEQRGGKSGAQDNAVQRSFSHVSSSAQFTRAPTEWS